MLLNLNKNKLLKKRKKENLLDQICSVVKYGCSLYLLRLVLRRKSDISYTALHTMLKKLLRKCMNFDPCAGSCLPDHCSPYFFPPKEFTPFRLQEIALLGFDSCLVFLQFPLSHWLSNRWWGSGGWAMVFSYIPHPSPSPLTARPSQRQATVLPRQHPVSDQSSLLTSWVT